MKKMILILALGMAGVMSAKDLVKETPVQKSESENVEKVQNTESAENPTSNKSKKLFSNIPVRTSCGLVTYITWDSDWGQECLISDMEAADYIMCAP